MYSVPTTDPVGISLPFTLSPAADIVDDLPAHLQETCFGSGLTTMYSALLSPVPVMVLSVGSVPASLSPRQMGLPVGQQIDSQSANDLQLRPDAPDRTLAIRPHSRAVTGNTL
jgi:hypothetical protein